MVTISDHCKNPWFTDAFLFFFGGGIFLADLRPKSTNELMHDRLLLFYLQIFWHDTPFMLNALLKHKYECIKIDNKIETINI